MWDVCDALVASRPWNDCIQKRSNKIHSRLKSKWSRIQWHSNENNYRLRLNKWSKLEHPWWLTIHSLWGMGQLRKITTSCRIQWESDETNEEWTSNRGGATMQTSPCWVFRLFIPFCLIGCNPDKVHGGWLRNVNKANIVYRQKIFVPSDFGCCFSYEWLTTDWCLKMKKGKTIRIPTPRLPWCNNPNRVRRGRTGAVNMSNNHYTRNIIVPLGCSSYIWCVSGLSW